MSVRTLATTAAVLALAGSASAQMGMRRGMMAPPSGRLVVPSSYAPGAMQSGYVQQPTFTPMTYAPMSYSTMPQAVLPTTYTTPVMPATVAPATTTTGTVAPATTGTADPMPSATTPPQPVPAVTGVPADVTMPAPVVFGGTPVSQPFPSAPVMTGQTFTPVTTVVTTSKRAVRRLLRRS